jgi:hypothetical protein
MELLLIGIFIAGIGIWMIHSSFASALMLWGIGTGIVGLGFLICERSIPEYIGEQIARFKKAVNK